MKRITTNNGYTTFVDDEDYEELNQYKWFGLKGGNTSYIHRRVPNPRTGRWTSISMHRHILKLTHGDGKIVDHKDRNGLNNTRYNLRIVTCQENCINSYRTKKKSESKYKGVIVTESRKYQVSIMINKQHYYVGTFENEIMAARVYDSIVLYYFPDNAYTNFNTNHLNVISIEDAKFKYADAKSKGM